MHMHFIDTKDNHAYICINEILISNMRMNLNKTLKHAHGSLNRNDRHSLVLTLATLKGSRSGVEQKKKEVEKVLME